MNTTPKTVIFSSDELVIAEKSRLRQANMERRPSGPELWSGIAISGGGIRSATFALGAVQALAAKDILAPFDYISSVSGGSYLASSLQWWWSRVRSRTDDSGNSARLFGVSRWNFPFGFGARKSLAADAKEQTENLQYLMHHADYLAPGDGIGIWSGVGVIIRTVLISLLIWIPIFVSLFLAVHLVDDNVISPLVRLLFTLAHLDLDNFWGPLEQVVPRSWATSSACGHDGGIDCGFAIRLTYVLLISGFIFTVGLFLVLSIVFGLLSRSPEITPGTSPLSVRSVPGLVLCLALIGFLFWYIFLSKNSMHLLENQIVVVTAAVVALAFLINFVAGLSRQRFLAASYRLRRFLEIYFEATFIKSFIFLSIGLIPLTPYLFALKAEVAHKTGSAETPLNLALPSIVVGAVAVIGGVGSSLYGYYTLVKKIDPGLAGRIFAPIGAMIFLYGMAIISYIIAVIAFDALGDDNSLLIATFAKSGEKQDSVRVMIQSLSVMAIALAYVLAITANVNYVGLHRFYRDRLMEAFMPSQKMVEKNLVDFSPIADRFLLSDQPSPDCPDIIANQPVPYSIVNAIAILTNEKGNDKVLARGGDNFILSPMFLGSETTGWQSTVEHNKSGPFTVASAMAASGAAVNADAGYVGTGLTRGRLLSTAMSLLNMRLGIWIANPGAHGHFLGKIPTFLRPMLNSGLLGLGHDSKSAFVELADGGNFENLGLYELIRRKLNLILVIDGEADSSIALPGLVSAIHRIEQDFEAEISFVEGRGPERFVLGAPGSDYPTGVRFAASPFLVGEIKYKDTPAPGTLIYIKATMIRDLDFTTNGYWAANQMFPHQSTVDQFFTPDQFEAYRDLGFAAVTQMIGKLNLKDDINDPDRIRETFQSCDISDFIT